MIDRLVPGLVRSLAKIAQYEHPNRASAAAAVAARLDLANQAVDVSALARTDLGEGIPQFGFQAHAGAAALRDDVSIDQATARHGLLPV